MFRALLTFVSVFVVLFSGTSAGALPVATELPVPDMPKSPLLITAYALGADQDISGLVTGDSPRYIEVYNSGKTPVLLDGWSVRVDYGRKEANGTVTVLPPEILPLQPSDKYIPPGQYVTIDFTASVTGASIGVDAIAAQNSELVTALSLTYSGYESASVAMDAKQFTVKTLDLQPMRRKSLTATTFAIDDPAKLYDQGLYMPNEAPNLQITEILPNPRSCSPNDMSLDCNEYVELYNPTDIPVSLDGYRLRTGSKTAAPSSSNTVTFSAQDVIAEYSYIIVPMELTNSGSYVWLEDRFGAMRYDETVTEYPDMSSTTRKGQSWGVDKVGAWNYTVPTPATENIIVPSKPIVLEKTSTPVPCAADQERNPDTGRCRKIATATTAAPCAADEYRSPDTNRCRKNTSTASTLTPCKEGQERNLETNRCRSTTAQASSLKPCEPGQERNPETNRCKKVTGTAQEGSSFKLVPPRQTTETSTAWWIAGVVGALALGYAGWEWRHEIVGLFGRMRPTAGAGK